MVLVVENKSSVRSTDFDGRLLNEALQFCDEQKLPIVPASAFGGDVARVFGAAMKLAFAKELAVDSQGMTLKEAIEGTSERAQKRLHAMHRKHIDEDYSLKHEGKEKIRLLEVGDANVGKTSLISRFAVGDRHPCVCVILIFD